MNRVISSVVALLLHGLACGQTAEITASGRTDDSVFFIRDDNPQRWCLYHAREQWSAAVSGSFHPAVGIIQYDGSRILKVTRSGKMVGLASEERFDLESGVRLEGRSPLDKFVSWEIFRAASDFPFFPLFKDQAWKRKLTPFCTR